jgi:hypothetical protein
MIIVSRIILKLCTGNFAAAITLWPFIFIRKEEMKLNPVLINHEKIHLRQQMELLIVIFYLWYIFEFIYHFLKTRNLKIAYRMIRFEKEAYQNEHNLNYLKTRKMFGFLDTV